VSRRVTGPRLPSKARSAFSYRPRASSSGSLRVRFWMDGWREMFGQPATGPAISAVGFAKPQESSANISTSCGSRQVWRGRLRAAARRRGLVDYIKKQIEDASANSRDILCIASCRASAIFSRDRRRRALVISLLSSQPPRPDLLN